jgi:hypothetical protein
MMKGLLVAFAAAVFLVPCVAAQYASASPEDEKVLRSVTDWALKPHAKGGSYFVISPITRVQKWLIAGSPEKLAQLKDDLLKNIRVEGYDLGPLVDRLIERNRRPARVKLAPGVKVGYVLDDADAFPKYFEKKGGGWEKWYNDNPNAREYCVLSLPAVDEDRGLVLIYFESKGGDRMGRGTVFLFEKKGGELHRIGYRVVWVT